MLSYRCYRQKIEYIEHIYFKTKCKIDNRTGYYHFLAEVNWSCHNHLVLHKDMPIQYQQNHLQQSFHFPNTFLQLPPSQNPVIDFSTPARDLKDSFQEVTVPQPMPKIVAQNPQQKYAPNQTTSYPTFQNPLPNLYVIAILKYCHKNVSVCYGCSGCFRQNGYPIPLNDMIVVSKTQTLHGPKDTSESNID